MKGLQLGRHPTTSSQGAGWPEPMDSQHPSPQAQSGALGESRRRQALPGQPGGLLGRSPVMLPLREQVPQGQGPLVLILKTCLRRAVAGGPRVPGWWLEAAGRRPMPGGLSRLLGLATERTPSPARG